MNRTGDQLGGRYELTQRIAAGGMGEVWKATDNVLGRTVAVKLLKDGLTDEIGFTDRFRNEARLSAALTHGNIAQVYDYGEDDGTAYLVMEFVPGIPLSKIIADNAPLAAVDTVGLISQAATALNHAHRNGLIHRDVKPANMLVTEDGLVKLTDFGIARAVGAAAMTKTGEVMGTAQYLAPEAAMGREVTGRSDVYSLGVVAYEMLCGRRPFEADSPVTLALAHVNQPPPPMPDEVPPPVRAIVLAALEKDPGLRPETAAEFSRALRQAIVDCPAMGFDPRSRAPRPPAGTPGMTGPVSPPSPGSPQGQGAAAGAAALAAAGAAGMAADGRSPSGSGQGAPMPGRSSGPQSRVSGPNSGPQQQSAGPLPGRRDVQAGPAPTGPKPRPGQSGQSESAHPSGPNRTEPFAQNVSTNQLNRPTSGPQQQQRPGNPLLANKPLLWSIIGVVALIILVIVIVLATNGDGGVTPPPSGVWQPGIDRMPGT